MTAGIPSGRWRRRLRRWLPMTAAVAVLATLAHVVLGPEGVSLNPDGRARVVADDRDDIRLTEPGYQLVADRATGVISVATRSGLLYTSFPLTALVGRDRLPAGARRHLTRRGEGLVAEVDGANGGALERVVLTAYPFGFTMRFTAVPGPRTSASPRFFTDGVRGLDLTAVDDRYSADPAQPPDPLAPSVGTSGRTPLAPPPLEVQLHTPAGWFGMGLVEVPDATSMVVRPDGSVSVDYPLRILAHIDDRGAGGRDGAGMLGFPRFLVTFGADPLAGLRGYHDALAALGEAPVPGAGPAWWQEPIVDTWGEQIADHAARSSPLFTAAWVRRFVADWTSRYGLRTVTVVIDSRWQQQIGEAEPDTARFGGWTGMRALVDGLHAQGLRVMLWWPMWEHRVTVIPPGRREALSARGDHLIDPTAPDFESATATTMRQLLGSGPGQLDADGLKLDWSYDISTSLADPQSGWGAAALFRYLDVLHREAHAVRPDALIEASAAAPQFAAVTDAVRIYDAWSQVEWDRRAAIVSSADPGLLIDGDGWDAVQRDALTHAASSAVYGVPAFYFGSHWADGSPVAAAIARELAAVASLAAVKRPGGVAAQIAGGEWRDLLGSTVLAQTFDHEQGVVVWTSTACGHPALGFVVTGAGGAVVIPIAQAGRVTVTGPGGRAVATRRVAPGVSGILLAGVRYTVRVATSSC